MKKLFLTICFSIIGWQIIDASAKTVAFEDMEAAQAYKASQDNLPPPPPEDDSPDPRDTRAMEKYIMERLKKATISNLGPTAFFPNLPNDSIPPISSTARKK